MKEKSIVYPERWKKIAHKRAVFVPFDLPSGVLRKGVLAGSPKEIGSPYGRVYLCPDQVVIFGAIGAPVTALCMEDLIASGVREFLILGICGSLRPEYRLGTAVCITKAIAEEGTSRMYFSKKRTFAPAPALKRLVQVRLTARGRTYLPGIIVTTDAPYRETPTWVRRNQKRGAGVVDMETSAVFSVAEFHGVRAAALMVVSDELFSGTWTSGFGDPRLEKSLADHLLPFLAPGPGERV